MPVKAGNIFIAPPFVNHSSISCDNLRYFSLIVSKDQLFHIETPVVFMDNNKKHGQYLSQMILENRYGNEEFFNALCRAYIFFVLENFELNTEIEKTVYKIKKEIISCFCDSNFNVTKVLNESGYAEDYIRAYFKKILGKTPIQLLTEMRIDNAKSLINVYRNSMPLFDIALNSGFDDYIYFWSVNFDF
jgi:AraC-like DNA-binding protein